MKPKPELSRPFLRLLLAVKGQADNMDLLARLKENTEVRIELKNPRNANDFLQELQNADYNLIICDHLLLTKQTLARLAELTAANPDLPLISFAREVEQPILKQARAMGALHTFPMEHTESPGMAHLVQMILRYALLAKRLSPLRNELRALGCRNPAYAYEARIDGDGRMITEWVSDSFQLVTGHSREAVTDKGGWIAFVYPDDLPAIKSFVETLLQNTPASVQYRVATSDGRNIWLESAGEPVWNEEERRVVRIYGNARNVSEREQLKQRYIVKQQQQNILARIAEFGATRPKPEEFFRQAALLLTQTLDAWMCEIFVINRTTEAGELCAATGVESGLIGNFSLPANKDNELGYAVGSNAPFVIEDLRKEKRFRPSGHLRKQKAESGICVPIRNNKEVLGMLALYHNEPGQFSDDDVPFVHAYASLLASFLAQSSRESQLKSTREALVERTHTQDMPVSQPSEEDDISVIVKTAKELRNRDVILSATSKITRNLMDAHRWEDAMQVVIKELGHASNASRAYLFSNHADLAGDELSTLSFEWVNKGIDSRLEQAEYKNMALSKMGLERIKDILSQGGIVIAKTDELPPGEQQFFKKNNVKSTAMVPIFVDGKWWGFLGFDACNQYHEWSSAEVDALRIAANIIATALERKQNETAMQAVLEGTVGKTGQEYFRTLLKHLSAIFDADYCLIAEAVDNSSFKVEYALHKQQYLEPFEYRQENSSFDAKNGDQIIHYTHSVYRNFPENKWLKKHKIEGYIAIPVLGSDRRILGHIAVMSTKRLDAHLREMQILKIFAGRVGVELERQRMEAENRQLARISLLNPNMVVTTDLEGRIIFSNPACAQMMKRLDFTSVNALLPKNHEELIRKTVANGGQTLSIESSVGDSTFQWNYHLQQDLQQVHIYAIDMTHYRKAEDQLRKDAFHDALTGLPNRNYFNTLLRHAIEHTERRKDYTFAVLFLDLDRFKYINDSLGHSYGDMFLEQVAQLLKNCLRPGDHIARFGGDEFAILLESVPNEEETVNIANRIQQTLSKPILLDQHETFTSASIGIALSNRGYSNPQDIIRDADIAMYSAKQAGKARHAIFDSRMHEEMVHVLKLETDLRHAVANNELKVYYQPIYNIAEKRISGFEALVRWIHPLRGFLEPHDFIPLAEEMSIIRDIDYLVLNSAAKKLKLWQKKHPQAADIKMNINLSAIHFNNTAILAEIGNVIKDNKLTNDCIRLELTEGVIMENSTRSAEIFNVLSKLGIHISIDDFGVGYSSLSRLTKLPVDMLKIDRGFVQSMTVDSNSLNVTRAVIDLAHDLDMQVIAEGVETRGQFQILSRMGCQYIQGYYISKPLGEKEAEEFLINPPNFQ
ncbi:MAG TPA: EAL domain-containing protein [Gammaproteobacteria bacterium]|nr:EAL domain-containing protein [Gammaproteobacteria bacterium]